MSYISPIATGQRTARGIDTSAQGWRKWSLYIRCCQLCTFDLQSHDDPVKWSSGWIDHASRVQQSRQNKQLGKINHCRWLAQAGAEWAQYQHRYAVPTRLVERLLETPDSTSQPMHTTLTSMVITVFTSPLPLSTSRRPTSFPTSSTSSYGELQSIRRIHYSQPR
jgi:hypothetical protein